MQEKDLIKAKKELANLYLYTKLNKKENVKKNKYNLFIQQNREIQIDKEINELIKKPITVLVQNIKEALDIIISLKLDEELKKYINDNSNNDPNIISEYEKLLQKEEADIREHISVEHQLKIQCEKFAEKLDLLEDERIFLMTQIVRINN